PGQWITGFYSAGNGVLSIANIPWTKYTHINHFAAAPGVDSSGNGNGTVELHYLTTTEITQIVLAAHAAGKKVIVTIKDNDSHLGAFGQSTSPTLLATFVSNITNLDRKSTRLNSSHQIISYAVFCLKKKKKNTP